MKVRMILILLFLFVAAQASGAAEADYLTNRVVRPVRESARPTAAVTAKGGVAPTDPVPFCHRGENLLSDGEMVSKVLFVRHLLILCIL